MGSARAGLREILVMLLRQVSYAKIKCSDEWRNWISIGFICVSCGSRALLVLIQDLRDGVEEHPLRCLPVAFGVRR